MFCNENINKNVDQPALCKGFSDAFVSFFLEQKALILMPAYLQKI